MGKLQKCIESIALYSLSGVGKTTQTEELARWIRKCYGEDKVVRLASANADGWGVIQPAVDDGHVIPTWLPARDHIIRVLDRVTQGWWPEHPEDPESPLLPPEKQKGLDKVMGTVFDSGTDFADSIMRYALHREAAKGSTFKMAAESAAHSYKDGPSEDEIGYASAARGHYGADQNRMEQFLTQSRDIPNQYIMWTFLEDRGKDPVTKAPVYAPDVIGVAINGKIPSWFGRTLRLSSHMLTNKAGENYTLRRMWLHNHVQKGDPIPYLANARDHWMHPLPDFLDTDPERNTHDASLYRFFELLKESHERVRSERGKK